MLYNDLKTARRRQVVLHAADRAIDTQIRRNCTPLQIYENIRCRYSFSEELQKMINDGVVCKEVMQENIKNRFVASIEDIQPPTLSFIYEFAECTLAAEAAFHERYYTTIDGALVDKKISTNTPLSSYIDDDGAPHNLYECCIVAIYDIISRGKKIYTLDKGLSHLKCITTDKAKGFSIERIGELAIVDTDFSDNEANCKDIVEEILYSGKICSLQNYRLQLAKAAKEADIQQQQDKINSLIDADKARLGA